MEKGIDYIGVGIGAVIINEQGQIFLAKRGEEARNEKGKWECPGGAMDFGESFEETITREMKEEFGIEIEVGDPLEPYNDIIKEEKQHWVAIAFLCKIKSGIPKILEPDKCDAIGWFSLEDSHRMPLSHATQERLRQVEEILSK